jgi:transposase
MPNVKEHFVGIDVAKDELDVAVVGVKDILQFANTKTGIAKMVRRLGKPKPKLIVVEATGGYEEAPVLALFEAGLPVALVSPQRVRQYAKAKGLLTKTSWIASRHLHRTHTCPGGRRQGVQVMQPWWVWHP